MHGRSNTDNRICADRMDGLSVSAIVVAAESAPGEKVVAVGEGSPSTAEPPEITQGLSTLLSRGPAGNGRDQLECEAVVRSEESTREKEKVRDAGLCLFESGVCLLRSYG